MLRIGIFGGGFSPVHSAHIDAAVAFMRQMWIDVLFVLPTALEHSEADDVKMPTDADRLEMCRLAFDGIDGVIVSDAALRRGESRLSMDTVREFSGDDRRLFLFFGTDVLLSLDGLYDTDELFKLCYPVYVRRENDRSLDSVIVEKLSRYMRLYGKNVIKTDVPVSEMSSSSIRASLKNGESVQLPPSVGKYISERGLYAKCR